MWLLGVWWVVGHNSDHGISLPMNSAHPFSSFSPPPSREKPQKRPQKGDSWTFSLKSLFVPPVKIISRHTLVLCFLFCTYKHANPQKRLQSFFGWIFNPKNSSDPPIVSFSAKKSFAGWHVFVPVFHLNCE